MFCIKCGFDNRNGEQFCVKCGTPIYHVETESSINNKPASILPAGAGAVRGKAAKPPKTAWFFSFLLSLLTFLGAAFALSSYYFRFPIEMFTYTNFNNDYYLSCVYPSGTIFAIFVTAAVLSIFGFIGLSFRKDKPVTAGTITLISGYALIALGVIATVYNYYCLMMIICTLSLFVFGLLHMIISANILTRRRILDHPERPRGLKRAFVILTVLIILISAAIPFFIAALEPEEDAVVFEDDGLELNIRASINKIMGPITPEDMERVEYLYYENHGAPNVEALEYCINMKELIIYSYNEGALHDISALSHMSILSTLTITNGNLTDLSPLASLVNLKTLFLDCDNITDISALSNLTSLEMLSLDNNKITDVRPLANLRGLTVLYLKGNPISDYSPLDWYTGYHGDDEWISSSLNTPYESLPPEQSTVNTVPGMWGEKFAGMFTSGETAETDNSYTSGSVSVTVSKYDRDGIIFDIADIYVSDLSCFAAAFSGGEYGRQTENVSNIASQNNAIVAISGDNYLASGSSTVVRNRMLYRAATGGDVLLMYDDGSMQAYSGNTEDYLEFPACYQVWGNGRAVLSGGTRVHGTGEIFSTTSFCAIGYLEPGHYVFVIMNNVNDAGPRDIAAEMMTTMLEEYGCTTAYILGGGDVPGLVFRGEIMNDDGGGSVSDIIYIRERVF